MSIIYWVSLIILFFFIYNYVLEHAIGSNYKLLNNNNYDKIDKNILITQYDFENYKNIEKSTRKKIFIHIPYERNERKWNDFQSRSSNQLNIELCVLCIKSVIHQCSDKYDIILYDNYNVGTLINEADTEDLCNIKNPSTLSGVDLTQWENYCKAKILYKYGGIVMEPYFFFYTCPSENILFPSNFHVLHHTNEGLNVSSKSLIPTTNNWLSSPSKSKDMKIYLQYLTYLCVHHYSVDHKNFDKTFEKLYALGSYNPKYMGIVDIDETPIETNDLLSKKEIQFDNDAFCVFINIPYFKKYTQHAYILKMNETQIKSSNTFLGEFISQYYS